MSRPRIGKHSAVFPPGYVVRNPVLVGAWQIAIRSRWVRAFMFTLPPSRFRMFWVAHFYWREFEFFNRAAFRKVIRRTVAPDAELEVFRLGNYRGPKRWEEALRDWIQSFPALRVEMEEFINPPHSDTVVLCGRGTGRGSQSDAEVKTRAFFVIRVRKGMAVHGRFCDSRAEALEAAGLSE